MAKTVYFSFHYERDILRVQQVKQHYVTKENYTEAGYFDGSLEEKAKKDGIDVVKKMIDKGMIGSSVLCVLIGQETYTRGWVDYEILRAVEKGMGVFGIRIHKLKCPNGGVDSMGSNPFSFLGYGTKNEKLNPMVKYDTGWKDAPMLGTIDVSAAAYLAGTNKPILDSLFAVYDWVNDDGYNNFGKWVDKAAKQANR